MKKPGLEIFIASLGKGKKPKGEPSDSMDDMSYDEDIYVSAFQDLVSAMNLNPEKVDPEAGAHALKVFIEACLEDKDSEDMPEDEYNSNE